jgi:branched-chain amino acid transport system permease protein
VKPAASQIALLGTLLVLLGINALTPRLDPYFLEVCMKVGISIILAVSLNLVNGYTGQFSLGHAGFMAVGAYTSAAITLFAGPKILPSLKFLGETGSASALFLAAIVAAGIMASITGLLVGAPSLRLKGDYLAIVTLGFGEIIRVVFRNIPSLGGAIGLNGIPQYTNFFWTFASAAVCIYVVLCMVHSTYGRGFIAVHDDEVASEAMGINTTRYKITAFVVGAFFAGIAGALYSHQITAINPKGFNFILSIEIVVMVILGGMGNTGGVILAAILLTLLPEFLRAINQYRMIIYSFLLIVLMLTRPQGLFNFRNPWKRRAA